jgi:hypothetical protein
MLPLALKPVKAPPAANLIREPGTFTGPRIVPGDYMVRLTRGTEVTTTKVKVVQDPRSKYTAEDRAQQFRTAKALYDMMGDLTYLTDAVIDTRKQVGTAADKLPATDPGRKTIKAYADDLDALRNTLSATREGMLTGEEKLRERLGTLYGTVNSYDGPPSGSQLQNMELMQKELAEAAARFKALNDKSLAGVNTALAKAKLPAVAPISREEWQKRLDAGPGGAGKGGLLWSQQRAAEVVDDD